MDALISDYLRYLERRHRQAGYPSDMDALAGRLGIELLRGEYSVASGKQVQVSRGGTAATRRADTAHELVHTLSEQGQYTGAIRREHASVPDLDEHLELLTEHGADLLLMPDALVADLLAQHGETATAVARLAQEADVSLQQALRRFVFLNPAQKRVGYLLQGDYIWYALATGWARQWIGSRLEEAGFREAGGTLCASSYGRTGRIAVYCEV